LQGIAGFLHVGSSTVTLIFHADAVWTWKDWVMDGTDICQPQRTKPWKELPLRTDNFLWHWNISEHQPGPLNSKGLGTNMILKYPEGTSHGVYLKYNILVGDWNMAGLWLSIQLGMENNPNWRTPSFFRAGQPPTRLLIVIMDHSLIFSAKHQ
jgi:hypothetical protein